MLYEVYDVSGRTWFKNTYEADANDNSYAVEEVTNRDPFQNVYNEIANDMVKERNRLTPQQLLLEQRWEALRQIAADSVASVTQITRGELL